MIQLTNTPIVRVSERSELIVQLGNSSGTLELVRALLAAQGIRPLAQTIYRSRWGHAWFVVLEDPALIERKVSQTRKRNDAVRSSHGRGPLDLDRLGMHSPWQLASNESVPCSAFERNP